MIYYISTTSRRSLLAVYIGMRQISGRHAGAVCVMGEVGFLSGSFFVVKEKFGGVRQLVRNY